MQNVLGANLKKLRLSEGMTLDEMAEFIGTGRTSYYNYERGYVLPPADVLILLAEHFGLSVEEMLYSPSIPRCNPIGENRAALAREYRIIDAYRQLNPETQGKLLAIARNLLDEDSIYYRSE